ncbi:MAG: ribonuclease H [Candidatus Pacebacteria bacterium CG_4_10_14_0_8_um_filter_43_12]|nr:MAG: ribonuclease H [Candidatus Pacebacteria bacterium CG10_big_fil_rev_8_21_14_0_10_44_11]PIY79455.1 MAG: ribonuclease H [Candidatus Pacebacteria bacterium CG_4_10_14_0_8_um_filter_43_12]
MNLVINTDGGSRGNPGAAAIGILICLEGKPSIKLKQAIGIATNNEAEYTAVLTALNWLLSKSTKLQPTQITWKLDSKLVVEQLSRKWKIKDDRMYALADRCWQKLSQLPCPSHFVHIPREENKAADKLVNQALDESKS